jgi:ribosomal protein L11 methyltransferase
VEELKAKLLGVAYILTEEPDRDWAEFTINSFQPLTLGRVYITRFGEDVPAGLIGLNIPAAMAFGSGEHATTAGCLTLYQQLVAQGKTFANGLDMGCGSAILAMAAAKLGYTPMLAVDIDAQSVELAAENIQANGLQPKVQAIAGDGFSTPAVQQQKPFDLVFANILADPLVHMAPELMAVVKTGGSIILSGFTADQTAKVVGAYISLGARLITQTQTAEWVAATLEKK